MWASPEEANCRTWASPGGRIAHRATHEAVSTPPGPHSAGAPGTKPILPQFPLDGIPPSPKRPTDCRRNPEKYVSLRKPVFTEVGQAYGWVGGAQKDRITSSYWRKVKCGKLQRPLYCVRNRQTGTCSLRGILPLGKNPRSTPRINPCSTLACSASSAGRVNTHFLNS